MYKVLAGLGLLGIHINDTSSYGGGRSGAAAALFGLLYAVVFALGVSGNALVCVAVLRRHTMRTVTNLLVANLALSDILLCALAVPFTPLYLFLGRWPFGAALCHLVPYAQSVSVYVSSLTLTAIAVHRFRAVVHPLRPRLLRPGSCGILCVALWVASALLTLPYAAFVRLVRHGRTAYCEEVWPSLRGRQLFGALTTAAQFVLPLGVVGGCYVRVGQRLRGRRRRSAHRTQLMLLAMVLAFALAWLPLNACNLLADFHSASLGWPMGDVLFLAAHAAAMSSTCYDPLLYAWFNDNFRKQFVRMLHPDQQQNTVLETLRSDDPRCKVSEHQHSLSSQAPPDQEMEESRGIAATFV
ncbi:prolactin-releasing peptide receptor isoform X1 [Rhipicephalus microplus]|uniref:prolactin-releasing peptide receptor isoform X1 n=2 Tax=Rhipicephalus microplus TaxID=6941 RepID=UPI003F6D5CF3